MAVVELLFCLPIANGRLRGYFSLLKLIKDNQRTCLKEDTLDHLLRIKEEGPPLARWELWWSEESHRVTRHLKSNKSALTVLKKQRQRHHLMLKVKYSHLTNGKSGSHQITHNYSSHVTSSTTRSTTLCTCYLTRMHIQFIQLDGR